MRKVAYVAADAGPRMTLEALAPRLPGEWALQAVDALQWADALRSNRIELLIAGTSDSSAGRTHEGLARAAASRLGLPCVVIEDFPGNYKAVPSAPPNVVVVECEFAAALARAKTNAAETLVEACPAVRYDTLRRRLADLRRAGGGPERAVLWIGQPETRDSLETLQRLLPVLAAEHVSLWFRAHPRDAGYRSGAYHDVLWDTRIYVQDMTARSLDECLVHRPQLVITQFSSVALEAGFWGIPALNVLFRDLGGARLLERKGYSMPGWCTAGAAFAVTAVEKLGETLDLALNSAEARVRLQKRFDDYFSVSEEGAPRLINVLYNQGFL
jgi:hypothetical protein